VAFLRFTRDRRGYENTFLLHAAQPGERPRVLYWYRSAPGVRVGRPALDEDAIRTIEEQHPGVDFDWPQILEVGAITQPEVERELVPPRRRPLRPQPGPPVPQDGAPATRTSQQTQQRPAERTPDAHPDREVVAVPPSVAVGSEEESIEDPVGQPALRPHDVLEELVGREIATRLRARYAEIISRIHRFPVEHAQRSAWEARAQKLNPNNWVTPDEVLRGVQHADALFDSLRRELLAH
jgi:hypothetical protein